ncbi:MAG: acyl-CoA dehydrogenase family protein [Euryarchaeota archaeon]|nr:acyl-CoA dehydrogenase family protein [Euryarchaeota archaeon]
MALLLSPEQELIKKVVADFARQDLAPDATRMDRESVFLREHVAKMAPLGLLGMFVPPERGGAGTDTLSFVVAVEEVASVSGTDAMYMILQNALVTNLAAQLMNDPEDEALLRSLLKGEALAACAISEEASGAQPDMIRTTVKPKGGLLEIKGAKSFVAMAGVADTYLVLCRGPSGPQFVAVPKGAKGLHFSPSESKLGLRGLPLADMYLNGVEVPASAALGESGEGWKLLDAPTDLARLGVASALVGLTQGALDMAIDFAKGRVQFGQPIAKFGAIRAMIADVQAELEAARATTYGAAALRDSQKEFKEEVLEARLLAHRIAIRGTKIAHKIHGGAGFMRDLPLERMSRDVRTLMHVWDAQDVTRSRLADLLLG